MRTDKFEPKRPEIPIGKGKELNEALYDRLLIFGEVENKVVLVNEEVYAPFKLQKGEKSPLGVFAKSAVPESFQRKRDEQRGESWPRHERSALLGRVLFKDKQGRFYRDIDLKGIGYIEGKKMKPAGLSRYGQYVEGIAESKTIFKEHNLIEKFLEQGIRVPRVLAIINLEEIIYDGKKISLEEARRQGIIKEDFQPVVEVRAFGTKARIADIFFGTELPEETKKLMLEDAKTLVGQELGRGDNPISDQEYLDWFAETMGRNVALMHKKGWFHSNLSPHNMTLDCRLCDFDTVKELKKEKQRKLDVNFAMTNSIQKLVQWLDLPEGRLFELLNRFNKSYDSVFSAEERKFLK